MRLPPALYPRHGDEARELLDALKPGQQVGVGVKVNLAVAGQGYVGEYGHIGNGGAIALQPGAIASVPPTAMAKSPVCWPR